MFDLVGFIYVLRFSDFQNVSRFHHRKIQFFMKALWEDDCFGPTKIIMLFWCPWGSQNIDSKIIKISIFQTNVILCFVADLGTILAKKSCLLIDIDLLFKIFKMLIYVKILCFQNLWWFVVVFFEVFWWSNKRCGKVKIWGTFWQFQKWPKKYWNMSGILN